MTAARVGRKGLMLVAVCFYINLSILIMLALVGCRFLICLTHTKQYGVHKN